MHLASNENTPTLLASQIQASIIKASSPEDRTGTDGTLSKSYRWTLATWLLWLWRDKEGDESALNLGEEAKRELRKVLFAALLSDDEMFVQAVPSVFEINGDNTEYAVSSVLSARSTGA